MQPNGPQNPTTEPKPDSGGYYKQVSDADPLAQQTSAPTGNFDFMLKEQPKQKRSFGLSGGIGMPAKILISAVGLLFVVIVAASFLGGSKTNSQQILDMMAQNQEIQRVTEMEQQQLKDQNVINLAATTTATLTSQQSDFGTYLTAKKVKYGTKQLSVHQNPNTDTQLQAAAQNNNLDGAYVLYLNTALKTYQTSMQTVFKGTKSDSLKLALQQAFVSVNTLLSSPQFKS